VAGCVRAQRTGTRGAYGREAEEKEERQRRTCADKGYNFEEIRIEHHSGTAATDWRMYCTATFDYDDDDNRDPIVGTGRWSDEAIDDLLDKLPDTRAEGA
jgi:hypothetical protein